MFTSGKCQFAFTLWTISSHEMLLRGERSFEYVYTEHELEQYSDERYKVIVSADVGFTYDSVTCVLCPLFDNVCKQHTLVSHLNKD